MRTPGPGSRFYWLVVWLGVAFLGPELHAVATDPARTLSWSVWWAMNLHPSIAVAVWGLLGWLVYHFSVDFYRWRTRRRRSGDGRD